MTESTGTTDLGAEDRKILTLARSARARNGVPEGAAVRDETGRTYVAGTVELESLKLSALRTAVAMAVESDSAGSPFTASLMSSSAESGSRKKSPARRKRAIRSSSISRSTTTSFPPGTLYSPCTVPA